MVDGAYDATNYRATLWNSNLDSTEAVIASSCHESGPSKCSIYESIVAKIQSRVDNIIHGLTPISVPFASQGPAVVTADILQDLFATSIYTPVELFPTLASILVTVETRLSSRYSSTVLFPTNATVVPIHRHGCVKFRLRRQLLSLMEIQCSTPPQNMKHSSEA